MWVAIKGCVVLVDALEHKILALLSLLLVVFDHNLQRTFGFQDVEFFIYGRLLSPFFSYSYSCVLSAAHLSSNHSSCLRLPSQP